MNSKFILSEKREKKNPAVAFILSFMFTGTGQIYNGKPGRGIILFSFRTMPLIVIPLYASFTPQDSYISTILFMLLFCIIIMIAAPLEAMAAAIRNRDVAVKKYNNPLFYIFAVIINLLMTALSIIVFSSFFSFMQISESEKNILFREGDIVLINKYYPRGYARGETVLCRSNGKKRLLRIMATGTDSLKYTQNRFYINNSSLTMGAFSDSEMDCFSLAHSEDVISEENNGYKYPVKADLKNKKEKTTDIFITPGSDEIFAADDNRLGKNIKELIKLDSIIGRAEGVILSDNPAKILTKPFIKIKTTER